MSKDRELVSKDPELAGLIEQAARNLATLELLGGTEFKKTIEELQLRIQRLKDAYTRETDHLTQQILRRAIERRRGGDRRKPPSLTNMSSPSSA